MEVKTLYQTLKDKNNDDYIVRCGPFVCRWENTWLGTGYYFWDTFIENAKWWGKYGRNFKKYIITTGTCDFNIEKCFDLAGHTSHIEIFTQTIDLLKENDLYTESTTVAKVIEYLKITGGLKGFEAIRVNGMRSRKQTNEYSYSMNFENDKPYFLDLKPPIQICLFEKTSLNFRDFKIHSKEKI